MVRDPHMKQNLYWCEIQRENLQEYECARDTLEGLGYEINAVVVDGKRGLTRVFENMPVQMCHFHQKAIVRRYLTKSPRLRAGRELKDLSESIGKMCESCFALRLSQWHGKWSSFLSEKTVNEKTGRWHYAHRRLRSAYLSLKRNLPYLYTYMRYPELGIPNTTNTMEGTFSYLKGLVRVHRGIKADLKHKMIFFILQNRPTKC